MTTAALTFALILALGWALFERIGRVFTEMADCHRVYLAGPPKVITLVKEVAQ